MKKIHTEIEINASAEEGLASADRFRRLPEWNPFVRKPKARSGSVPAFTSTSRLPGATGCHSAHRPGGRSQSGTPMARSTLGAWAVRRENSFSIEPMDEGRVQFVQRESDSKVCSCHFSRKRWTGRPCVDSMR